MFVSIKLYVNFFLISTLNWNISKLKNSYFTNTRENFFKLKKNVFHAQIKFYKFCSIREKKKKEILNSKILISTALY